MCSKLFDLSPTISTDPRHYLSKEKLAAEGLDLITSQDGEMFVLIDKRQAGKILGIITVVPVEYLYQWAPLDYHQSYIENGGVNKDLMREIINEPPQAFGKGFYVSTNPYDSTKYGNGVTVFKTASPLITIENSYNPKNKSANLKTSTTEMIEKFQRINIDAIQTSNPAWLSIINHKHLKTTKNISRLDSNWTLSHLSDQILLLANLIRSGVHHLLPQNHILRRILAKKLTAKDIAILKTLPNFQMDFLENVMRSRNSSAREEDYEASLNLLNQAFAAVGEPPLELY